MPGKRRIQPLDSAQPSAFVIVGLRVSNVDNKCVAVTVDMDVIPPNPYEDVWNSQPWCGHRHKTTFEVVRDLPIVQCE
jgi:hypothetical protein